MPHLSLVLWSADVPSLAAFLELVAGGVLEESHPGFAAVRVGETQVEVHADEAYRGHPWFEALHREGAARGIGSEIRIAVDDVDAAWRRALDRGGVAVQPPVDMGQSYECVVMGPDGYLFSFWRPAGP